MKFKVGDKVKIRDDLRANKYYGCKCFVSGMNKYKGKIATITYVYSNFYKLDIDSEYWNWSEEMVESVDQISALEQQIEDAMAKSIREYQDLQKQLMELKNKKEENESGRWEPEIGEGYYYISEDGSIIYSVWHSTVKEICIWQLGNCFKTKEEAEFEAERRRVIFRMKDFAFEPDWEDSFQKKYYISYSYTTNDFHIDCLYSVQSSELYFESKEKAQECISTIGEENIKKYYLKVLN